VLEYGITLPRRNDVTSMIRAAELAIL